jgi:hypothetical protein
MPTFVISAVFEVTGGKLPHGADVLARAWGMGHRLSYCDGLMLTLVADQTALDAGAAFESVLSRAEMVWQGLGHGPLGAPVTVRVHGPFEPAQIPAGIPPADTPPDARRRRRKIARELKYFAPTVQEGRPPADPRDGDDPPDDGGLAGVREPRRPRSGPPGLHTARDLPDAQALDALQTLDDAAGM